MGLLSLFEKQEYSYYGTESHKYVDKLLRDTRNLYIISPYLDEYYADYLAAHSRGKKVYIISSAIKQSVAKKLHGRGLSNMFASTLLFGSLNSLLYLMGTFSVLFALLSAAVVSLFVALYIKRPNNISLKIPRGFVHAKVYVGDTSAIEGSANLTYAGTHKNVEHVRVISDPQEVERLKREFWTLWNSF